MIKFKPAKNILLNNQIKQMRFFGYDNLIFKTVNLPTKQKLINICKHFSLKKIIKKKPLFLNYIKI